MGGTEALNLTNPSVTTGGIYGNLGSTGGFEVHQLTQAQMPAHTHNAGAYASDGNVVHGGASGTSANITQGGGQWRYSTNPNTGSTGSSNSHNNIQPSIIVNQIIRAL